MSSCKVYRLWWHPCVSSLHCQLCVQPSINTPRPTGSVSGRGTGLKKKKKLKTPALDHELRMVGEPGHINSVLSLVPRGHDDDLDNYIGGQKQSHRQTSRIFTLCLCFEEAHKCLCLTTNKKESSS